MPSGQAMRPYKTERGCGGASCSLLWQAAAIAAQKSGSGKKERSAVAALGLVARDAWP